MVFRFFPQLVHFLKRRLVHSPTHLGEFFFDVLEPTDKLVDGFSGATPLLVASSAEVGHSSAQAVSDAGFSIMDMFYGFIPGRRQGTLFRNRKSN